MEDELLLNSGDNGEIVGTDIQLQDFGEVLEMLKLMPKQDNVIKHYSQYANKRYYTGCTIMEAINALATIKNYDFSEKQISEVYDVAESKGRVPGHGWSRGAGLGSACTRWNKNFPNDQVMYFGIQLFSDEFYLCTEKLGVINVSINVDSKYRKDARDNLRIDGEQYSKSGGHATVLHKPNEYNCIDSIPQDPWKTDRYTPMLYTWGDEAKIDALNKNGNLRTDAHVIIFNNWLKQEVDSEEKKRLQAMVKSLNKAIEVQDALLLANSEIRGQTNSPEEKDKRHSMNENIRKEIAYNKAKVKIVEAMLK